MMNYGKQICWLTLALLLTTGCKVRVDNADDGKNVKIATPFGSIAVNQTPTTASEVGLPSYPGAALSDGDEGGKAARVDMGFGSWKLRVRVAHYTTADDRDQVLAFYRKALGEYGVVIECAGDRTVGKPVKTGEGLTCEEDSNHHSESSTDIHGDLELKAGSPRHQHLVAIKGSAPTQFSLVALDLPHETDDQHGTN